MYCPWPSCNNKFTHHKDRSSHMIEHLSVVTDLQCSLFVCYLCPSLQPFSTEEAKFHHTRTYHLDAQCLDPDIIRDGLQLKFANTELDSNNQVSAANDTPFACPSCPKVYQNKTTLARHINLYHSSKLICPVCPQRFSNGKLLHIVLSVSFTLMLTIFPRSRIN